MLKILRSELDRLVKRSDTFWMPKINPGHKFCIRYAKYLYFDKKGVKNGKLAVFKKIHVTKVEKFPEVY